MGSETSFLLTLAEAGYEAVYCPQAVVHHRIEPRALSVDGIFRRAYRCGRGNAHTHGKSESRWLIPPRLVMASLRYISTLGRTQNPRMVARRVHAISRIGWCVEKINS
jgi:GT2 family glycosyltransferase